MWLNLLQDALPAILQFVEIVFARPTGAPSNSTTKLGAAVSLAQNLLTVAASAGAIPVAAANDVGAIASQVQSTVTSMKAQGMLGGNVPPSTGGPQPSRPAIVMPQVPIIEKAPAPALSASTGASSTTHLERIQEVNLGSLESPAPAEQVREQTAADIVAALRKEHKS